MVNPGIVSRIILIRHYNKSHMTKHLKKKTILKLPPKWAGSLENGLASFGAKPFLGEVVSGIISSKYQP